MTIKPLRRIVFAAASFALLIFAVPAQAQFSLSGSGGSSGAGSALGSSGTSGSSTGGNFSIGAGNNFLGTTSGTSTSLGGARTQSGTTGVGNSGPFGPSYNNPISLGLAGLTTFPSTTGSTGSLAVVKSPVFGTALFNVTPTTTSYTNTRGGSGTANITAAREGLPVYASSVGVARTAQYTTVPRFKFNPRTLAAVEADARDAVRRSSRLDSKDKIAVTMDGSVVVLRGAVADADERNMAEDVIRLTPGVADVRNELTVRRNAE